MNRKEFEDCFEIVIPDTKDVQNQGKYTYLNPYTEIYENTSIGRVFDFNHYPLKGYSDFVTNDFDYYSKSIMKEINILPFACDAGGYFFCFDYRKNKNNPAVVLWIRDNPEGYDIADLALSFEEFIDKLKSADELK